VTDHRINLTLHALDKVMDGDLDPVVGPLVAWQQAAALEAAT
ncbi:MAG: peptide chain release factor 1, partial [Alphaproteobacteria bacterium]